jgi:FtsZ-interacting cell division protein YlmF
MTGTGWMQMNLVDSPQKASTKCDVLLLEPGLYDQFAKLIDKFVDI